MERHKGFGLSWAYCHGQHVLDEHDRGKGHHLTQLNLPLTHLIILSYILIDTYIISLGFLFRASPQGFKTRLLGEGFHTLLKDVLFSSPTNVGHHNPPPSGPSVLVGTRSFLQSIWDPLQIHPLWGPASLLAHRLVSTPFRE